jgi:hypothetical protein
VNLIAFQLQGLQSLSSAKPPGPEPGGLTFSRSWHITEMTN